MALKSKKRSGDEDEDGESPFMSIEDVMRKLKAGPLNFGVFQTGDKDNPVLLAAHKRKNPTVLGKQAKKEAGTTKGAFGSLSLESGELNFQCENDDPPASLKKKIKLMLKSAGYAKFKPRILLPGGVELGDSDDDEDDDDAVDEIIAPGGSATKTTDGGDDDEAAEEAKKKEAHHILIDRAGDLENQVYDSQLDESHPELLKMLQTARGDAHDERFEDSKAALDEAEAAIKKAVAAKKKEAEGGKDDPLKAEVDAIWAEAQPILETLIDAGDSKVSGQAAKLLKLMEAALKSGDYKKAKGAMVVVSKFIENALDDIGDDDADHRDDEDRDDKPEGKGAGAPGGSGGGSSSTAPRPATGKGTAPAPGGTKPDPAKAPAGGGKTVPDAKAPQTAKTPQTGKTPPATTANGAPPVTKEENERLAAMSPEEIAKQDLTIGDTKKLFSIDYMKKLKDAPIKGEADPKLKDLMGEIEKGLSGKRRLEVMEALSLIVGVPPTAEKLDLDYGRFLVVREQQRAKGKAKGEEVPDLAQDVHKNFRGSRNQLMFGKVLGDAFGIHEVFAALLSPTGGLVGPGNKFAGPIDAFQLDPDNPIALHGTVHDAAGYLKTFHDEGPGYVYRGGEMDDLEKLISDKLGPAYSGQITGIKFWTEDFVDTKVAEVEKKLKSTRDAVEAEIEKKIKETKKKVAQGAKAVEKAVATAEKKVVELTDAVADAAGKAKKVAVEKLDATTKKIGEVADTAKRKLEAAWDFIWN